MDGVKRCLLAVCVLASGWGVQGQVSSLCRPNELLLVCGGCQKTCENPSPACAAVCRVGCYCPDDLVRDKDGVCIELSKCPSSATYQSLPDTSEPRPHDMSCPDNEEYRFCEPCNKTCDNPNPICPAQCARGCFCKDDLVRDGDGKCVKVEQCNVEQSNYITERLRETISCGVNQEFKDCENCEKTCSDPNPVCPAQCSRGCYCKDGYVKSPSGECVKLEDCPKAEENPAHHHLITTVDDCADDEVYLACGWCEPTCSEPKPSCPVACTSGCLCRPPLLRHHGGQCVIQDACHKKSCEDENAEYTCRYPCEDFCSGKPCFIRAMTCSVGCYCKKGYLKEDTSGRCVKPSHCLTKKNKYD